VTGKHELRRTASSHGTGGAGRSPVFTRLRLLAFSRWRLITGAASATAVAFCLVAFACSLIAVAGPRATAQLDTSAFRQLARATPAGDKTVMGSLDAQGLGTALNRTVGAAQIAVVKADLRRNLGRTLPLAPAAADWDGLTTAFTGFAYRSSLGATKGGKLELVYRDNLSKNAHVVAGSLPAGQPESGAQANATIQIAVTTVTAKRFNLRVGSKVPLGGSGTVLQVTGIVGPVNQGGAPFWNIDPVAATPLYIQPIPPQHFDPYWEGGAFVSATQVGAVQNRFVGTNTQLIWTFPLALDHLTAAQASRLPQQLPAALSTAGQLFVRGTTADVSMSSTALTLIGEFGAQEGAVGNLLNLMSVSLAVVGAAVVLLVAWLVAEKRREEFAVLRARGASLGQLAAAAFAGSAVAALPGAAAGWVVAVLVTPGGQPPLSWWLGGLTVVVALAGPIVITVRMHRGYAAVGRPDRPAGRVWSLRRLVAEAALALGSAGGLIALRHQGAAAPQGGDLYASAAPILAAVPVAIVMLRLYPLLVVPLLRLAARRTGVTAFLGLARAARVSATAVLPAFAMVLALSLVSFAGMVRGAVIRGEVAQSWQAVGADAVVSLPSSMTAAQQHAIARLPGVQASVPVAVSTAQSGPGAGLSVVFADPAQYAALMAATPLGAVPASFVSFRGGSHARGPVPALVSPSLTNRLMDKTVTLNLQFGQQLRVQGVGAGPAMSQVQGITGLDVGGYIVVPASAASRFAPPPSTMLIVGPRLDGAALTAAVAKWHVAGASVVRRAQLLSGLEQAPLQRGAYAELAVGGAAAAVGCLLVLLLTLMLSGQSREMTLARATTMGLSAAQGRALALIEALPQILSVVAGGLVSALVLVPLVGPTLGLSVFTGSAASVPVRIEPAWLAGTAIALLVLAIVTVTGQMVLASRQAPRSLRIGG
jgi:putative ABC transport system permease protein